MPAKSDQKRQSFRIDFQHLSLLCQVSVV